MSREYLESISTLERRVQLLEDTTFGPNPGDPEESAIQNSIQNINLKLAQVDKEIPDIDYCFSMLKKVVPLLSQKRSSLHDVLDKAEEVRVKSSTLELAIQDLGAIDRLQHIPDMSVEGKM